MSLGGRLGTTGFAFVFETVLERIDMNAVTRPARAGINAIVVYVDPALIRKNQIIDKLEERGLVVSRTYESGKWKDVSAEMLADISCVIVQGAVGNAPLSHWKTLADQAGARLFRLPHQTSRPEWRSLEEWIGRAMVVEPTKSERSDGAAYWKTRFEGLESDLAQAKATALRAQAEAEEARSKSQQLAKESKIAIDERAVLVREREGLRERAAIHDEQVQKIHRAHEQIVAQLKQRLTSLEEANAAFQRGITKLQDERNQAIETARKVKELNAQLQEQLASQEAAFQELAAKEAEPTTDLLVVTRGMPEWFQVMLNDEIIANIRKCDELVKSGLLEPNDARAMIRKKHGV